LTTPIDGWLKSWGPVASNPRGRAISHLGTGDFEYGHGRFVHEGLEFNMRPEQLEADTGDAAVPGCVRRACMTAVAAERGLDEEALEHLVHQESWPDQSLEDREQVLAERVGLLPEEHKRADQA